MVDLDFYTQRLETLKLLGGFWPAYGGRREVESYTAAAGRLFGERMDQLRSLVSACGRRTCPLYRTDRWYRLAIRREDLREGSVVRYGDDRAYGDGLNYGAEQPNVWRVDKPEKLRHAEVIASSIVEGAATFVSGQDFEIDATTITFFFDPFADPRIPVESVLGDDPTEEVVLWLAQASFDFDDVYQQFGYVFGLGGANDRSYRDAVNAIYDAAVDGPSDDSIRRLVAASFGCSVVEHAEETVVALHRTAEALWIVTDLSVYRFPPAAESSRAVGDVVFKGDTLTDDVRFGDFRKGSPPSWLPQVTVPKEMLGGGYLGGLTFASGDVDLEYSDGAASFPLGGHPFDVAAFWEAVAANGEAQGKTFAEYLDVRANPSGPTTPSTLPDVIDPLQFAAANLLRNNAVVIDVAADGLEGDGLDVLRLLRDVLPLGRLVFLLIRYRIDEEAVTVDDDSGPTSTDESAAYDASEAEESLDLADDESTIRKLGGECV